MNINFSEDDYIEFSDTLENIVSTLENFNERLADIEYYFSAGDATRNFLKQLGNQAKSGIVNAGKTAARKTTEGLGYAAGRANAYKDELSSGIKSRVHEIRNQAQRKVDVVKDNVSRKVNSVKEGADKVAKPIRSAASSAKSAFKSGFEAGNSNSNR